MTEIEQAKQVLDTERQAVLAGLAEERAAAERAAEEQRRWRAEVEALLERGRAVGLSIADMADALGVSRQWTNHLAKRALDREIVKRIAKSPPPQILGSIEFGLQQPPPPKT
jgi:antitoxin component HigA of HigAB toxin-antitoxin module